jgi:hypothetical protein
VFALFRQTQSAMADEHGGRLDDNAFVEALCRRALKGGGTSERPAHQIAITVCESCKRGWQNGAGREIEVGPEVMERASCDAELIGSLDAAQPARVTATVTPRIRRQVLARDHHRCTVDGCRSARNLDLHHIEYQRDGGKHELSNMTTVCSGHHAQVHSGALTIRGKAPDALACTWRELEVPHEETVGRTAETRNDDQHGMATMPDGGDRSEPDPTVRNASTQLAVGEEDARAMRAATVPHVGCDQEMLNREEEQDEELKLGGVVQRDERPVRPSEPAQPGVSLATRPAMVWRYVGTRVDGPHATNLEMGIPGGRAASHGGEGNRRVAKEREGHETSGGVCDCGTNTRTAQQPGRSATSRPWVEYAEVQRANRSARRMGSGSRRAPYER